MEFEGYSRDLVFEDPEADTDVATVGAGTQRSQCLGLLGAITTARAHTASQHPVKYLHGPQCTVQASRFRNVDTNALANPNPNLNGPARMVFRIWESRVKQIGESRAGTSCLPAIVTRTAIPYTYHTRFFPDMSSRYTEHGAWRMVHKWKRKRRTERKKNTPAGERRSREGKGRSRQVEMTHDAMAPWRVGQSPFFSSTHLGVHAGVCESVYFLFSATRSGFRGLV